MKVRSLSKKEQHNTCVTFKEHNVIHKKKNTSYKYSLTEAYRPHYKLWFIPLTSSALDIGALHAGQVTTLVMLLKLGQSEFDAIVFQALAEFYVRGKLFEGQSKNSSLIQILDHFCLSLLRWVTSSLSCVSSSSDFLICFWVIRSIFLPLFTTSLEVSKLT